MELVLQPTFETCGQACIAMITGKQIEEVMKDMKTSGPTSALADKIISESQVTDEWYEYFDDFASLLDHPKSLVRNRVIYILAANAHWGRQSHSTFQEYYHVFMKLIYQSIRIVCVR